MSFDPFDPLDYFLYEEFLDPGMKYECQQCGTRFGDRMRLLG